MTRLRREAEILRRLSGLGVALEFHGAFTAWEHEFVAMELIDGLDLKRAAMERMPQVACPFHREQTQWSRRLHRLGVAPKPVHQRSLTAERLAGAIRAADGDPRYREAAHLLAGRMRAEGGVPAVVRVLERMVGVRQH